MAENERPTPPALLPETLGSYLRSILEATAYVDELELLRNEAQAVGDHEHATDLTQIADVLKMEISEVLGWRDDDSLICTECGREPCPDENAADNWRVESDGLGELHVFCPACWQRGFGGSG